MPKFNDLITLKLPPQNRIEKTDGRYEKHLTEAAVMLSYAMYLFEQHSGLEKIEIHPDGEHGKQFDIRGWLEKQKYMLIEPEGRTHYGGKYVKGKNSIHVSLKPGLGDVVANLENTKIVAECKGGIINTRHPGQKSKLRRGLCEAVGLLMSRELSGEEHFAVVPYTNDTQILASRMVTRCKRAGIYILFVHQNGKITSPSDK